MLSAQTHALQKNKNGGQIPHFLREIEVASDSDPLFSFLLRVPYNVHFSILASSFVYRLNAENFRSSYLLVPAIKVLYTRSYMVL